MDERDGSPLDTARSSPATDDGPAEGDDIVVEPAGAFDAARTSRRRAVFALSGLVVALLIVGGVALVARHTDSSSSVKASPAPPPSVPVVAKVPIVSTVPRPKKTPVVVASSVPATAPQSAVTSGSVAPPATPPATPAPTTVAAPKQYGPSALTWVAPTTFTLAAGTTKALSVTARNGTDGTVTLPHPLSCTPRLDHGELCTENVQLIAAGQSASARYTIDAHGVAPGHYTLNVEGVLTVRVTVS